MGHKQYAIPLKTDNSTCAGFVNNNIRNKRSKAWDMRYWWLREKEAQKKFRVFWDKGENNNADYYTKHHAPQYHRKIRRRYVFKEFLRQMNTLKSQDKRGCVDGQIRIQDSSPVTSARTDGRMDEIRYNQ